jgi:transcriptional regulator with XRE-family HTH domain
VPMAKRKKTRIAHAEIVRLFAERLRELRHSRGMTQAELARAAQVSAVYVGRLEAGRAAPGIDLVDRLARALGATLPELLPAAPRPETLAVLKDQARVLLDTLFQATEKETFLLLNPLLRLLADRTR